jgi:glycosyltransferase involved in cell wall biosynthesis
MNILYVVNDFFPRFYGGVERYVLNISKQMQRVGRGVTVLTYGMDDSREGYSKRGDILFKRYTHETVPVISVRHPEIPGDIGFKISDDILERNLYALLREEAMDIIHVAHPMKFSPIVNVAKKMGIPVVLTLTDFWLLCPRGRFYKPDYSPCNSPAEGRKCVKECGFGASVLERYKAAEKLFHDVDQLIAPSRFISKIFENNGWQRKITVVRHGVDYRYVRTVEKTRKKGNGSVVLGYTGLVTRFKGVDLLIDSFRKVKNTKLSLNIYGNVYTDWVWEREFFDGLKKMVEKDDRIKLRGRYSHDELPSILNGLDVNIVPSTTLESYGLVVTESLSYRVPVIASDIVGSAYEFLSDGVNGFVFSVNNPESLTEKIERIASDPSIIDALRQNIVSPPRIEEEAFMLERIYSDLVR